MDIEVKMEKNYMFIIKPGITDWQVEELSEVPRLDKLKAGLDGGMLEIVPHFNKFMSRKCIVFVDEEGKLKGLPRNDIAHLLWEKSYGGPIRDDYLVGPIVIIVGSPGFLAQL